jgi:hypothetical protein
VTESDTPASARSLWRPYVFDVIAPFACYLVVHALGAGAFWALAVAGLLAGASTAVNTVRRRGLDAVGVLVVLEIAVSIALLVFVRDERLLLVRPSFYTAVAAVYLAFSAWAGRPLSYAGSRPMAASGGPARLAAYERAWERSPEFRRAHRLVTLGIAFALAVDSVLRAVVVYRFPVERSAWLSNVPHVAAIALVAVVSALAGRRFGRIVDAEMAAERPTT